MKKLAKTCNPHCLQDLCGRSQRGKPGAPPPRGADADRSLSSSAPSIFAAGLTLDRYGHLYESDVEAVGVAINALLTRNCGQNVVTTAVSAASRAPLWAVK
jgi:hypothetical protein